MKTLPTKLDSTGQEISYLNFIKQGKLFAPSFYLFISIYLFNVYYEDQIKRKKYIFCLNYLNMNI